MVQSSTKSIKNLARIAISFLVLVLWVLGVGTEHGNRGRRHRPTLGRRVLDRQQAAAGARSKLHQDALLSRVGWIRRFRHDHAGVAAGRTDWVCHDDLQRRPGF